MHDNNYNILDNLTPRSDVSYKLTGALKKNIHSNYEHMSIYLLHFSVSVPCHKNGHTTLEKMILSKYWFPSQQKLKLVWLPTSKI